MGGKKCLRGHLAYMTISQLMRVKGRAVLKRGASRVWWCTPLVTAFQRQRQVHLCEFEASLAYISNSRAFKVTQRNAFKKGAEGRVAGSSISNVCNRSYRKWASKGKLGLGGGSQDQQSIKSTLR